MKAAKISKLRLERIIQGKSQNYLSFEASMPQSVISLVERGLKKPSELQKMKFSQALGISMKSLFPEENGKNE